MYLLVQLHQGGQFVNLELKYFIWGERGLDYKNQGGGWNSKLGQGWLQTGTETLKNR